MYWTVQISVRTQSYKSKEGSGNFYGWSADKAQFIKHEAGSFILITNAFNQEQHKCKIWTHAFLDVK